MNGGERRPSTGPAPPSEPELTTDLHTPTVVCDGRTHEIGTISGATPGGNLQYTSPGGSYGTGNGKADSKGRSVLYWTCYDTVETTVTRTATDLTTSRTVTYQLRTRVPELTSDLHTPTVVCDGRTHEIGTISGATPGGNLQYTSPGGSYGTGNGKADSKGRSVLYWTCNDTATTTVIRIATDQSTGRSTSYELTAVPSEP